MDLILASKSLILGIIEGLTEFLPISSTGHLIIAGSLLDMKGDKAKVFYIAIQLAAILAIVWVYRQRFRDLLVGFRSQPQSRQFGLNLLAGVMPALVLGFFFGSKIKAVLFNPLSVAAALVLGGGVILWVERRQKQVVERGNALLAAAKIGQARVETVDDLRPWDAFKVGLAQTVAMIPGTSRSGATIIGGMLLGLSRKAATEFSFFLAVPTMFAATAYDVLKNRELFVAADLPIFALGFVASFIAAILTVRALVRFVSTHGFTVFAWYRIALGILILLSANMGWIEWHSP